MEENFVGYLLNALEPEEHRAVESYVNEHPEAAQRLQMLRQALQPLEADRHTIDPPPRLTVRTMARADAIRRNGLPPAPPLLRSAVSTATWWRRPDVVVAAGLMLCILGLGSPTLYRLRHALNNRQACSENLRVMHQSLVNYSSLHDGEFPRVEDRARHNVAGAYVPILNDAGFLAPDFTTRCPANGEPTLRKCPTMTELEAMSQIEFERVAPRLSGCYAYTLGYRDPSGRLHGLRIDDGDDLPILADRPLSVEEDNPDAVLRGNSPNHRGQNVLFIGGHVRFHKQPTVGRCNDNIFLNRQHKVAAGVDRNDSVLGLSADQP
jgi:hypothetical protein